MQDPSDWRLVAGNIPIKLISTTGKIGPEDASAVQEVLIQSANLPAFAVYCFPLPVAQSGSILYPRRRYLPGFPALVLKDMDYESWSGDKPIDPFSGDPSAPSGTYDEYLKVTLNYGTAPENDQEPNPDDPRTFLEVSCRSESQFLSYAPTGVNATWDQASLQQDNGNAVKDADLNVVVPNHTQQWTLRWPQVPYSFFNDTLIDRLNLLRGKVNLTVLELFNDAPAETIMFTGYDLETQYTWREDYAGISPVNVVLTFVEKNFLHFGEGGVANDVQVTHNHFFDPRTGRWRKIYIDGKPVYHPTELSTIWTG